MTVVHDKPSNRGNWQRGQAVTEFAFIFPILILVFVALFDLGRAVYAWSTISDAARTAGRIAIVDQDETLIKNAAVAQALALGLTPDAVTVTYPTLGAAGDFGVQCEPIRVRSCIAQIVVTYDFNPATPVLGNIIGVIHLSSTTRIPIEHTSAVPTPTP
jgi:Flp pilus assembly protein TadG